MIVCARQNDLSILETADPLGFSCRTLSRVCSEGCGEKEKKHPVSCGFVLLMREVRAEWPDWFKLTGKQ